jgi:hypothetical protein
MAYDARINELRSLLVSLLNMMSDASQLADTMQGVAEHKALTDALDRYETGRSLLLMELEAIVDGNDASSAWGSKVNEGINALHEIFGDALRDVETPTIDALGFVTTVVYEEEKFYDLLASAVDVAFAMDKIAAYRSELAEGIEVLEKIWATAEDDAAEIMRDEDTVAEEIKTILEKAASEVSKLYETTSETFLRIAKNDFVIQLVTAGVEQHFNVSLNSAGEMAVEILKLSIEQIEALSGRMEIREDRFRKYFESHMDSVLVMFEGSRKLARNFVKEHDYQKVLELVAAAQKSLSDLTSNGTPGQKRDAAALGSLLYKKLENAYDAAQDEWDTFVTDNQPKFFGPVGPGLDKALLGSDRWNGFYSSITAISLQDLLKKWVDESRKSYYEIDQSDAPEAWQPQLRMALLESLKKFAKTAEEYAQNHGDEAFEKFHRDKFKKLEEKFKELG